jgi:8-oxo-dGTP diphosphatase
MPESKTRQRDQIELISRGLLRDSDSVLLCRSIKHGYCYLPGGHVDFGESARAALEREFLEEGDLAVKATTLLLVSEEVFKTKHRRHHEVNLVFHVEANELRASVPVRSLEPEISFDWVPVRSIGDLDVRPPSIKVWLERSHDGDTGASFSALREG